MKYSKSDILKKKMIKLFINKNLDNANALEMGCGNGFFTFLLAPLFKSIHGFDINKNKIIEGRKKLCPSKSKNIIFFNKKPNKKYDVILFTRSLHFMEIKKELSLCNLENNGIIIIIEPTKFYTTPHLNKHNELFDKKRYLNKLNRLAYVKNYLNFQNNYHVDTFKFETWVMYILKKL